jgi:hypothetical protein
MSGQPMIRALVCHGCRERLHWWQIPFGCVFEWCTTCHAVGYFHRRCYSKTDDVARILKFHGNAA